METPSFERQIYNKYNSEQTFNELRTPALYHTVDDVAERILREEQHEHSGFESFQERLLKPISTYKRDMREPIDLSASPVKPPPK